MSTKRATLAAAISSGLAVIIGLTMQFTAYAITESASVVGLSITSIGVFGTAAVTPSVLAVVRTAAHDEAYLTHLTDQRYDQAVRTAPIQLGRRAQ